MTTTAAAVLSIALAAGAGAPTVSDHEFARVHHGWSRAHVERVFDTHGTRALKQTVGHHQVLMKTYPWADGLSHAVVIYRRPLDHSQPWRVTEKYANPPAL